MSDNPQPTPALEQSVIRAARQFTRTVAEFPDYPAAWAEWLDALDNAVAALDSQLDREFAKRMA